MKRLEPLMLMKNFIIIQKELGGRFESYIEEVAKLMIPLLKFYFHDGVRCSAAQCIAPLVNCTMESRGEAAAKELWNYSFKEIIAALESEPELEIIVSHD